MDAKKAATSRDLVQSEALYCAPNYHPLPVVVDHAKDCLIWDVEGRQYLDMMGAYSAVSHGHLHPRLVAAAQRQLERVAITSRAYHSTTLGPFLAALCQRAGFERALPMNTGAEAVETAIKAVRRWGYQVKGVADGQAQILVARGNFHGRTTTVISASSEASYRHDFGPFTPGFSFFDFGEMASVRAATSSNSCAVLVEPIQGEAGVVLPPAGFFAELRDWCSQNNMLLIIDEVQAGLGRTGRWFAFEHEGIRPDGLILGKALGGGLLPVSAFLADRAVMDLFTPGSHGSTFGGNALAAAVGLEALKVMEDEQLVARSAVLGRYLLGRLTEVGDRTRPLLRAVRGRGLWVGVEVDPVFTNAREVVERMALRGVLSKETHETVIRFAPPLTVSREQIDQAVAAFEQVLLDIRGPTTTGATVTTSQLLSGAPLRVTASDQGKTRPAPCLLMSPPDFFEVSYSINPWMDPARWAGDALRLQQEARSSWAELKTCYEKLGAQVVVQPAQPGLPDLVFTANSALVLDGKVLLARFLNPERALEQAPGRELFESLRKQGLVESLEQTPEGVFFEGAGDAIVDAGRGMIWMGYGQRSSLQARDTVQRVWGLPTFSLELVDPSFYHLDTCFCLLAGGEVLYFPPAFSAAGCAQLQCLLGDQLIAAEREEALNLGVNSFSLGRDLVMGYCSATTRQRLLERGYRIHQVNLASFNLSGGGAYCLTLRLDQRSQDPPIP
ncbi:MAG: ornithine--oxo-acid transaminase [Burkholderiaceae bacterium]